MIASDHLTDAAHPSYDIRAPLQRAQADLRDTVLQGVLRGNDSDAGYASYVLQCVEAASLLSHPCPLGVAHSLHRRQSAADDLTASVVDALCSDEMADQLRASGTLKNDSPDIRELSLRAVR